MLIAFSVLLIMISVNLIHLFVYLKPMEDTNFFDYLIWSWLLLISNKLVLLQFISQIFKIKRIKKFINFMQQSDDKLKSLNIDINYSKDKKVITVFIMVLECAAFLQSIENFIVYMAFDGLNVHDLIQECCYAYYLCYKHYFVIQFIIPTYFVQQRFKALNGYLR